MSTLFGNKSKTHRKRMRQKDDDDEPTSSPLARQVEQDYRRKEKQYDDDDDGEDSSSSSSSRKIVSAATTPKDDTEVLLLPSWASFADLGLAEPLVATCRQLGFRRPTAVQRTIIPFLIRNTSSHLLALSATGSGKTAAFVLPILHHLSVDPYGIYAVVLTPTRELAQQIHQQVLALGSAAYGVKSALVVGGLDATRQSCELDSRRPHFCVATPGRLAQLLRGPQPPRLQHLRFMVLDEADRLLTAGSGFERDVAELLLHTTHSSTASSTTSTTTASASTTASAASRHRAPCQTLLFSATMSRSLESVEEMAGAGMGRRRLPLKRFVITEEAEEGNGSSAEVAKRAKVESTNTEPAQLFGMGTRPKIPAGLRQEYIFMPSRVRDAYLLATIRNLMLHGGRTGNSSSKGGGSGWTAASSAMDGDDQDDDTQNKARSAIIFVSTCERAAFVSGILSTMGVDNVALHSLLSQNRRLASLGKFKSQQVCVLVATDVASRGLDIPTVDLVVNAELPRQAVNYIHRCGRTARAGRRGRAISLVAESDISLVHAAEKISGRSLEKCTDITDDLALKMLGPVSKAARLTKLKLNEIGFEQLVEKAKERKLRDAKERQRIDRALKKKMETTSDNKNNMKKKQKK